MYRRKFIYFLIECTNYIKECVRCIQCIAVSALHSSLIYFIHILALIFFRLNIEKKSCLVFIRERENDIKFSIFYVLKV